MSMGKIMNTANEFEFDDLQALIHFGHGHLTEACFLLLNIADGHAAKRWLSRAPITNAVKSKRDTALQIAFSVAGLRMLGLGEQVIDQFSDEFITGMAGDLNRSRRLGDVGDNAPQYWTWGGESEKVPHVLLLLYARKGKIVSWRNTLEDEDFSKGFQRVHQLPTFHIGRQEPFGFLDGISQPKIDWQQCQSTDEHDRNHYSNLLAIGELVLGYPNEYGLYTTRPLIDPNVDPLAAELPPAKDQPTFKDLGRNGTYLVIRQLEQDVPGFWRFMHQATGSLEEGEKLAAKLVGRQRDGTPLIEEKQPVIPGIRANSTDNRFTYDHDPKGLHCPVGAHIRRANPRTGDQMSGGNNGLIDRLKKIFGFAQGAEDDLVASARFHRILRRGRTYGPPLSPEEAVQTDASAEERGLQFICLMANIGRQFEFIQNAWSMNSKFNGVQNQQDPLLGNRQPLMSGESTDQFSQTVPAGPRQITCHLPQFITVRGGGYFFMPGLRALKYLASTPLSDNGDPS